VKFGAFIFPTEYAIHPAELGRALEERGFESLFVTEHTHIPAARQSVWPHGGGGEPPRDYWSTYDPFVALTVAACATETLRIGTGICLVPEHDPIVLAKQVASLDLLSGGRFVFGIGGGWNWEELANHGVSFGERWDVVREHVEAMKAIWSSDEATYAGEHVRFERIWQWPKPLQQPHPPILLGAERGAALRRVVDYCDGWMPAGLLGQDLRDHTAELRRLAADAGRPAPSVTVFGCPPDEEVIALHEEAGAERILFRLPSEGGREAVLPLLDELAAVVERAG
jgi:probable F420-dependent oxidoreductase